MVEITITLSVEFYLRLTQYAEQLGTSIEAAAITILENAFPPLLSELDNRPVISLSDAELIDTRSNLIDDVPNVRTQLLRIWQEESRLTHVQQIELQLWDTWYDANRLRKVELSEETVRRGLG